MHLAGKANGTDLSFILKVADRFLEGLKCLLKEHIRILFWRIVVCAISDMPQPQRAKIEYPDLDPRSAQINA